MSPTRLFALALVALLAQAPTCAHAVRTVVIDEHDAGTVSDGIIDGFPNIAAKDGTPDLPGNAPAVALRAGVTELRTVVEFPLAKLADVAPGEIVSATLTFNIDDVLSTFGPGTDFDGTAARTLLVHPYPADGRAVKGDYGRDNETAYRVDTGATPITDAVVSRNGAIAFTIDVRERLLAALADGTPFLGFLWRTNDSPTGTSIDNLGEGSSGPPGARGSRLPFLSIDVEDVVPPPPGCGDGAVGAGEQCDDGNTLDGDCCSRLCAFDAAGTSCSDGDACTDGDACDGAGACTPGAPRNCDDGSVCTTDSCDPGSGCVYVAVNEGQPCDDGNACTTGDVCGGRTCVGTPAAGPCDDGDACTFADACRDGECRGTPACGDGGVEASCGEECDDGNAVPADGCAADCRIDTLLGGTGAGECLLRFAFATPVRDPGGAVAAEQACTDGDLACDGNPAAGVCGFTVAACVGQGDARLPSCAPTSVIRAVARKPGSKSVRRAFAPVLASLSGAGCSAPVQVAVPVVKRGKRVKAGVVKVALEARGAGRSRDRDVVRLTCRPAAAP